MPDSDPRHRTRWRGVAVFLLGVAGGIVSFASLDESGGLQRLRSRIAHRLGVSMLQDQDLRHLVGSHWSTRDIMIRLQASQVPRGSLLLLGDSVIEGVWGEEVRVGERRCYVVNSGFGGIGVDGILQRARQGFRDTVPRFVVLSVGLNDAWPGAGPRAWADKYDLIIQSIITNGGTPVLMTILPPEEGLRPLTKSPAVVAAFNREIKRIAAARSLTVADIASDPAVLARSGPSPRTVDGVHPTGEFYRHMKLDWIAPAILAAERARGQPCVAEQ